jgi:hypothetical protein
MFHYVLVVIILILKERTHEDGSPGLAVCYSPTFICEDV